MRSQQDVGQGKNLRYAVEKYDCCGRGGDDRGKDE